MHTNGYNCPWFPIKCTQLIVTLQNTLYFCAYGVHTEILKAIGICISYFQLYIYLYYHINMGSRHYGIDYSVCFGHKSSVVQIKKQGHQHRICFLQTIQNSVGVLGSNAQTDFIISFSMCLRTRPVIPPDSLCTFRILCRPAQSLCIYWVLLLYRLMQRSLLTKIPFLLFKKNIGNGWIIHDIVYIALMV